MRPVLNLDLGEAVEETAGQTLAAAPQLAGPLRGEDAEVVVLVEGRVDLRDVD